ncbi:hypothetical protein D9M68_923340 [compost metagenome]
MMGMVEASGLGWQGRAEQAELVALYIRQQQARSAQAASFRALKAERAGQRLDGGYAYLELERMAYYVHKDTYRSQVKAHIAELRQGLGNAPELAVQATQ